MIDRVNMAHAHAGCGGMVKNCGDNRSDTSSSFPRNFCSSWVPSPAPVVARHPELDHSFYFLAFVAGYESNIAKGDTAINCATWALFVNFVASYSVQRIIK
jgi:hypothetical protein